MMQYPKRLTVSPPADCREELDALAARRGVSRNTLLRLLLRAGLEEARRKQGRTGRDPGPGPGEPC